MGAADVDLGMIADKHRVSSRNADAIERAMEDRRIRLFHAFGFRDQHDIEKPAKSQAFQLSRLPLRLAIRDDAKRLPRRSQRLQRGARVL